MDASPRKTGRFAPDAKAEHGFGHAVRREVAHALLAVRESLPSWSALVPGVPEETLRPRRSAARVPPVLRCDDIAGFLSTRTTTYLALSVPLISVDG